MVQNKSLIFNSVPVGAPVPGKDLVVETLEFDLEAPPPPGGVTVKNFYASFDPYMRGRMRAPETKSYSAAFTLGRPISSDAVATILKSDNPRFAAGDLVQGHIATQEYAAVPEPLLAAMRKIENPYNLDLVNFIGALGMPGLTAYSSLYEIGKPVKGETIFISAASGAVGQIVGQLAKREGLTVIGSVGSDDKLAYITDELGFDGAFNYKKEAASAALARLAPQGIDIYYENVGGEQLEAALDAMRDFGRIVACGMISQYNLAPSERTGITNMMMVVAKRITIRGFIVSDKNMGPLHLQARNENVAKWISEGSLKTKYSVTEGMDNAAQGFVGMLQGKNFGKAVLKIADM